MIPETYIVFYEGEDPLIEAPYFCETEEQAQKEYDKWARKYPTDASKLYIAKIIRRPKEASR